jgi:CubicO group peptidase (beta-lactamase class C family)
MGMRGLPYWVAFCAAAMAPLGAAAADIDSLFSGYNAETPGCAVGVSRDGQPAMLRAYGSADLEHAVPNSPETIFEAGSVSKQFAAAAVLILAEEGKLALTDDIRKYLPEMPDYGTPITLNHLLSHTSGLRDWGAVLGLGGWPRTSAIHTNLDVLHIAARQRSIIRRARPTPTPTPATTSPPSSSSG